MKKSQTTIFVIIILFGLIIISFFLSINYFKKTNNLIFLDKIEIQNSFENCVNNLVVTGNQKFGINENTKNEYENYLKKEIEKCNIAFLTLIEKDYKIEKGDIDVNLSFYDENIIIKIHYPLNISKDKIKYKFDNFEISFKRSSFLEITNFNEKKTFSSTDNLFYIDLEKIEFYGPLSEKPKYLKIRLRDKSELNFDKSKYDLKTNLVYELSPKNYYFREPIKIKFDILEKSNLITANVIQESENFDNLYVGWYEPRSEQWGLIKPKKEGDYLVADIYYTTEYALINYQETNTQNEDITIDTIGNYDAESSIPSFSSQSPNSYERVEEIYNQVKDYMNQKYLNKVTYPLSYYPNCQNYIDPYCFTGNIQPDCGLLAIHCTEDILSLSDQELSVLFSHEMVHNIQQKNNPKNRNVLISEFGAEYISGSRYKTFLYYNKNNPSFIEKANADKIKEIFEKNCDKSKIISLSLYEENAEMNFKECAKEYCIKLDNYANSEFICP
ncbi:MAG: hypothetical protein QW757_00695 [Candidatus Woesearchaeota archaeon]